MTEICLEKDNIAEKVLFLLQLFVNAGFTDFMKIDFVTSDSFYTKFIRDPRLRHIVESDRKEEGLEYVELLTYPEISVSELVDKIKKHECILLNYNAPMCIIDYKVLKNFSCALF